jgi:rod shape-determining protein MreC
MRRSNLAIIFVFFLFISFLFYVLSLTPFGKGLTGFLELGTVPLQKNVYSAYAAGNSQPSELQKLKEQNAELESQLAKYKEQDKEMQAFRDQFATTTPSSSSLLPVHIIGLKAFIPGVSLPEQIIIDKGRKDGVLNNDAVIYKNNVVGKVAIANEHVSLVDLSFKKGFSVTATTSQTNSLGISKGQGQGSILLDNVVLSDSLTKGDVVVTKGSTDSDESGIPPGLVIGKIISVDKKASNLFQTARVQSLVDITHMTTLFVVLKSE